MESAKLFEIIFVYSQLSSQVSWSHTI